MQDMFNDKEFDRFVEGVMHLDEDIGQLVYTLFKSRLVETRWSCSGHIGLSLESGVSTRPETHLVYHAGVLPFNASTFQRANLFLNATRGLVAKRKFASFNEPNEFAQYFSVRLEMKDLIDNAETRDKTSMSYLFDMEVRKDLAEKRYAEFVQFWRDLDALAKKV